MKAFAILVALTVVVACAPSRRSGEARDAATVSGSELGQHPDQAIERALEGRIAGLTAVRMPDGTIALRIRGTTTYDGSDPTPLYIVNDLPFEPGPGGALTGLNPNDIASIKVLKGADAGIYGVRGANGVIVITMKKPGAR